MPPVSWEERIHQSVSWHANTMKGTINVQQRKETVCFILTAIAMAMLASVTVSMGEEMKGVFMVICLVSADVRS